MTHTDLTPSRTPLGSLSRQGRCGRGHPFHEASLPFVTDIMVHPAWSSNVTPNVLSFSKRPFQTTTATSVRKQFLHAALERKRYSCTRSRAGFSEGPLTWALFGIMSSTENEVQSASQTEGRPSGFVSDILLNAVEPGVNTSVIIFINIVFGLLIVTAVTLTIFTGFNIHLIFFSILSVGLMIALNM